MDPLPKLLSVPITLQVGLVVDGQRLYKLEVRPLPFAEVMASIVDAASHPMPAGFTTESWERLAERARQTWLPGLGRRITLPELAGLYSNDVGAVFAAAKEVASRAASFREAPVGAAVPDDGGATGDGAALAS